MCSVLFINEESLHLYKESALHMTWVYMTYMFIEHFGDISGCFCVRRKCFWPSIRRAANIQRMPQPPSEFVLCRASGHHVCTVEADMLGLLSWTLLLLGHTLCEVCMRNNMVKFIQKVLMQLQNLTDIVLDGCSCLIRYCWNRA